MNPRQLLMGAALAIAAGLAAFGDKTPEPDVAEPVVRPPAAASVRPSRGSADATHHDPVILRLQPRETLIGNSADAFGGGENEVFGRQDWTPPPPAPGPAPPAPPPTAPPLPFTYIGKSVGEGVWEVYLARGDRTYILRDKDVVDGSYRVESIAPPVMTLTYLPLNQVQQLNIGVFD
jgi:hypothetical protein